MKKSLKTKVLGMFLCLSMMLSLLVAMKVPVVAATTKPALKSSEMIVRVGQTITFQSTTETKKDFTITKVKMSDAGKTKADVKINSSKKSLKVTGLAVTKGTKVVISFKNIKTKKTVKVTAKIVVKEADYLSKNGLSITPQGKVKMSLRASMWGINEYASKVKVSTKNSKKTGYVDTTAVFTIPQKPYPPVPRCVVFDRYTGADLTTGSGTSLAKLMNIVVTDYYPENVCTFDVNGHQYDCTVSYNWGGDSDTTVITINVCHPKEYDGVVFGIGTENTGMIYEIYDCDLWEYWESFDSSKVRYMDEYPEFLKDTLFFTESNN